MEVLAAIGLVGNIIQFVDFSSKLISMSSKLYLSSDGALTENIDIEMATSHLILMNEKLKFDAATTDDGVLDSLCNSCIDIADELIEALDKVKVKKKQSKWESMTKAIRSVWIKGDIAILERRIARLRDELKLHVVLDLREQISQFKLEQPGRFQDLDSTTKKISDAIIKQQDIFLSAHNAQHTLIGTLHNELITKITDEHEKTRREVTQAVEAKLRAVVEPVTGETMKLLSLDSGGIRGLSSLFILEKMMQKIKVVEDLSTEPLPCEYFDLICGTGTGGIIAIMLGRLRMSVSECIAAYLEISREIIGHLQSLTSREIFPSNALDRTIKSIVKRKLGDENAPLLHSSCCKTFVCTYEAKALRSPVLLRTYQTDLASINCTVWEAIRATSQAPNISPPIRFKRHTDREFINIGVGCNNPSKILIEEAKSYYRFKGYRVTRPTCLVSIGTGQKDLFQIHMAATDFRIGDGTDSSIALTLAEVATDCENTHEETMLSCQGDNAADIYYRFNVAKGIQHIVLDEWAKPDHIQSYTNEYMRLEKTEHELYKCIMRLRLRSDSPKLGQNERNASQEFRVVHIKQEGSYFGSQITINGGTIFQGNSINLGNRFFDETL